eukprot:SAG11_NODE_33161_length_279_cov_0.444444_1_plen_91_part_10
MLTAEGMGSALVALECECSGGWSGDRCDVHLPSCTGNDATCNGCSCGAVDAALRPTRVEADVTAHIRLERERSVEKITGKPFSETRFAIE